MNLYFKHREIVFLILLLFLSIGLCEAPALGQSRQVLSFDSDWRFSKGDVQIGEQPEFDDSAWRRLDVPLDWSIEGPFDAPNRTGGPGGFLPAGSGWDRKAFTFSP